MNILHCVTVLHQVYKLFNNLNFHIIYNNNNYTYGIFILNEITNKFVIKSKNT